MNGTNQNTTDKPTVVVDDEIDVGDIIETKYKLSLGLIFAIVVTAVGTAWGVFWFFDNLQDEIKSIDTKVVNVETSIKNIETTYNTFQLETNTKIRSINSDIGKIKTKLEIQ